MGYSRRQRSRRNRRGGGALSPALLGGRRSRQRRSRRGGGVNFPLSPAPVGGLASMSDGRDPYLSASGIAGAGITNGGLTGETLMAGGGYRSRRNRSRRRR